MSTLARNLNHLIICLFIFSSSNIFAQSKTAYTIRTTVPPEIDGYVTDSVWQSAVPVTDFYQHDPLPGDKPSFKTEVRLLYNDAYLYVSFFCYDDEPSKIIARELKLDGKWSGDDNVAILFDTFNDDRNAYWFGTNPLGMRDDILLTGDHGFNESWHGIWEVRSAITDSGWSTEMVFPFSSFKFYDIEKQVWGVNFYRKIQRLNEEVQWEGYAGNQNFFNPAYAGSLVGIEGIKRGTPIYLKPFVTAGAQLNAEKKDYVHKPGLDIKYGITETLSLDLTFNTDFAQVESDRAQINLTRFPLFFPEKRDFFLEGSSVFSFSIGGNNNLFYSRRIGLSRGMEIPILGGAKLVGKVSGAEIGLIDMQTARKGDEPTTNYGVARVKFDLLEKSYAGFFISNKYSKDGFNRVYAGDAGFSFSNFLGDKNLIIGAGIAKSDEENGSENSWAGKFNIDYPNDEIAQNFSYRFIQEKFNPAVGFISRGGIQNYSYKFNISPRVDFAGLKRLRFSPIESSFNLDKNNNLIEADLTFQPFGFTTTAGDEFNFQVERIFDHVTDVFEIFEGAIIPSDKYWFTGYSVDLESSKSRDFVGSVDGSIGDFYSGTIKSFSADLTWYANKHLSFYADFEHNKITLAGASFQTNEIASRIQYDFSTMVNSSLFAQWNNELNQVLLNYRFNWQPKVGSNFYFVVNQLLSTQTKLQSKEFAVLAKFVWLFVI